MLHVIMEINRKNMLQILKWSICIFSFLGVLFIYTFHTLAISLSGMFVLNGKDLHFIFQYFLLFNLFCIYFHLFPLRLYFRLLELFLFNKCFPHSLLFMKVLCVHKMVKYFLGDLGYQNTFLDRLILCYCLKTQ